MAALIGAFQNAGAPDAAVDARLLLCAAAGIDHAALIRDPDVPLDDAALERLNDFARRRVAREPVTRILAARGFWSLDLDVAPGVLDPRPDSETLIDAALAMSADRQGENLHIADLGCGSGALLCAFLDVFDAATGVGVDLSPEACRLTRQNLRRCGQSHRGRVIEADWAHIEAQCFDLIVSNPPYIATHEIDGLDPEVRDHDPRLALDGGLDGLRAYRSLATAIPALLAPAGIAIVELGQGQGPDVAGIFAAAGLRPVRSQRDLQGIERALVFVR